jgi:elongation factor Ts
MGVRKQHSLHQTSRKSFATTVTAAMVKELRGLTGAGMMDCKKALSDPEVKGDVNKAVDWLRVKGMAKASKNADREAKEGLVSVLMGGNKVTLLEVNSETDFVGRNYDFQRFVASTIATAHEHLGSGNLSVDDLLAQPLVGGDNGETVAKALEKVIISIRENIVVRRAYSLNIPDTSMSVGTYVHGRVDADAGFDDSIQMGSAASIVTVSGDNINAKDLTRKLAMHVVASKPQYVALKDVPESEIAREREVASEQTEAEGTSGKKPDIVERIIDGKVNKRLGELCLLEQNHVAADGAPKIGKFLKKEKLSFGSFLLWTLG